MPRLLDRDAPDPAPRSNATTGRPRWRSAA
jgi:hypothetical protein